MSKQPTYERRLVSVGDLGLNPNSAHSITVRTTPQNPDIPEPAAGSGSP